MIQDFINSNFGPSITQNIVLPGSINDILEQIGIQNFAVKENPSKKGFFIELDIDEFP